MRYWLPQWLQCVRRQRLDCLSGQLALNRNWAKKRGRDAPRSALPCVCAPAPVDEARLYQISAIAHGALGDVRAVFAASTRDLIPLAPNLLPARHQCRVLLDALKKE